MARETFPQARREAGTTHFRLPADTVGRGTVAQEVSGFVYAQPEHFVAETCPGTDHLTAHAVITWLVVH